MARQNISLQASKALGNRPLCKKSADRGKIDDGLANHLC
jgi:hypothetical protein